MAEKKKFCSILHPYISKRTNALSIANKKKFPIFGFIGKQLEPYKKTQRRDIEIVKKVIVENGLGYIETSQKKLGSREDYEKILLSCDYVIFLSGMDAYHYRSSGIFTEAMVFERPIICLSNSMTDYFFEKYGNIGYKYAKLNELLEAIPKIGKFSSSDYEKLQKNIKLVSQDILLNNGLRKIIKDQ